MEIIVGWVSKERMGLACAPWGGAAMWVRDGNTEDLQKARDWVAEQVHGKVYVDSGKSLKEVREDVLGDYQRLQAALAKVAITAAA